MTFYFYIVSLIHFETPVQTGWDAARYSDHLSPNITGTNSGVESKLQNMFPPPFPEPVLVNSPHVIIDKFGIILCWYLPQILSMVRQVGIYLGLFELCL